MSITKQVWPLVVKDMLERNEEGAVKYNRYLQTDCPDNLLQHAYEEALDLAVYLKTELEKQKQEAEKLIEIEKVNNELKRLQQMKSILDKDFKYVSSSKTNIQKTFDRIRKEQKEASKIQAVQESKSLNIVINKKFG